MKLRVRNRKRTDDVSVGALQRAPAPSDTTQMDHYILLISLVQAVQTLLQPYLQQGLDIFKTFFSVGGVAKLQIMKKFKKMPSFVFFPSAIQICTKLLDPN